MAYSYYSSIIYGNSTGPSGGYNVFRTCVQYYFEDNGSSWILKRRAWVEVTKSDGGNFSNNFTCNWLSSKISVGGNGVGTYGDSGWVTINSKFPYGGNVKQTLEGYYTSTSSGVIKSTASANFNAQAEPRRTLTLQKGTGVASFTGGGSYHYGTTATVTAKASAGYALQKYTEGSSTWTSCAGLSEHKSSWSLSSNRTVTVHATPNTYTITYNSNGGTGSPNAQSYVYNPSGTTTLSGQIPVRSGYKFLGWGTTPSAEEPIYQAGGQYPLSNLENVTLYACWKRKSNCFVKQNGTYKMGMMYVKENGTYKTGGITVTKRKVE